MNNLNYNPDVLSCLANLSNDEVFTPPQLANQMLDMLPQELFQSPDTKFLDPCTKSGVFLREIAKRLIDGLADKIPDLQERIDHIMHHQLYGIAITRLTSLMSRRSLYCSKDASCKYSISKFDDEDGNIRFNEIQHSWQNGKCRYCGASQDVYDRGEDLETHAYEFIHTENPKKLYNNMTFDVIIGNPPYQLEDGGHGASATPIYHLFVEQAKKLNPRYLSMIIPARWYAGGRGLDVFRNIMLTDSDIIELHDFPNASDCFPGVEIKGGVCFFLRKKDSNGKCKVCTHTKDEVDISYRNLLEEGCDTFIRYNKAISILYKSRSFHEKSFITLVMPNDPFGYDVRVENTMLRVKPDIKMHFFPGSVKMYYYGWKQKGIGYVDFSSVRKNKELVSGIKIFISRAYGAGESFPHQILGEPFIAESESVCTETYLLIAPNVNRKTAENIISYIKTKFFRFLVMLKKNTQSATPAVYQFVPLQDFSKPWTDEELYKKYGLTDEEIAFIESMIRPME